MIMVVDEIDFDLIVNRILVKLLAVQGASQTANAQHIGQSCVM
jgi:hypothetical protein